MRIHFFISLIFLFLFFDLKCFSQNTYVLSDTSILHRLDAFTDVFIDESDSIGFDSILRPEFLAHRETP